MALVDEGPLLVGLTGNIATGKSTVARMLAEMGADYIDADKVAHRVMRPDQAAYDAIVEAFGQEVVSQDGTIDRGRLGALVFADREAMARLEAVVHPATVAAIDERIAESSADVVVVEAIKLFEAGLADRCDSVWVTVCRRDQQIRRLVEGRDLSRGEARQRVDAQRPQQDRAELADVVIDNSGSLTETREQVVEAWNELVRGRGAGAG
jgi:dephospho-CoA kinase